MLKRYFFSGNTPLLVAAWRGHQDIVETLIESGCDIHGINNAGETALHVAALRGEADIARVCI